MPVPDKIRDKLGRLPDKPGVYLMRDATGRVIYVGKAASLRNRVRSYFRDSTLRSADPKLRSLVHSADDLEFIVLRSEAEATLIEGQFIKDYRPRYNVSFKDDKRFLLLRVNLNEPWPRFSTARLEKPDGAEYVGPYANSYAARAALEFVEKKFGLRRCRPREPGPDDHRHCLDDIVRFCSAPCVGRIDAEGYRRRVLDACAFLRGERPEILKELRVAMEAEAKALNFEKAAALRDSLRLLTEAVKQRARRQLTPDLKEADAKSGLAELQCALGLPAPPAVIEGYDISNISGTHAVASLVCAVNGLPARQRYRLFRIRTVEGSDDPAMMAETFRRRFARAAEPGWTPPDLVMVDGGLTQLRAARAELEALGCASVPTIGLAKRLEEVYAGPTGAEVIVRLPVDSPALKVLQRLRDEAHRFALTYHRKLRDKRIRESALDDIPGVGPKRKEDLLRHFGSIDRLRAAGEADIAAAPGIGPELAALIRRTFDDAR